VTTAAARYPDNVRPVLAFSKRGVAARHATPSISDELVHFLFPSLLQRPQLSPIPFALQLVGHVSCPETESYLSIGGPRQMISYISIISFQKTCVHTNLHRSSELTFLEEDCPLYTCVCPKSNGARKSTYSLIV